MNDSEAKLIHEFSSPGRRALTFPALPKELEACSKRLPERHRRKSPLGLPEVSQVDVVRHYTRLSQKNYSVDTGFYPLGSCTMKYNPKINEQVAALDGFVGAHPYQPEEQVQGLMEIYYELANTLRELTGLAGVSLQPAAGAHGEYTALLVARAHFQERGEKRSLVVVPDSAHGTNPASARRCGFRVAQVASNKRGRLDLTQLEKHLNDEFGVLMVTNPSTLGLFENEIAQIAERVHKAGGLIYMDGANFNAIMGITRPGDFGVDLLHLNMHKTFSTPHGGGGPGAGPICVRDFLVPYLPRPQIVKEGGVYRWRDTSPKSVGKVRALFGNAGVIIRAYCYVRALGAEGLRDVSRAAVLNANYLAALLKDEFTIPYGNRCMHEFVINSSFLKEYGVKALDIAKGLIDEGFHPPTTYFPLLVPEALMIEPTETETKETLEAFAAAMIRLKKKAQQDPEQLRQAPHTTAVSRFDEYQAALKPTLKWTPETTRDFPAEKSALTPARD
ncbi:MAG: aminomethyl-transferring glycine dehydrogenase subunit GcvPB [bacterium]